MTSYTVLICDSELKQALDQPHSRYWRKKGGPLMQKKLRRTLEKLKNDPYHLADSHRLLGEYRGLRSVSVDGRWRLLFKICEECERDQLQQFWPLPCCTNGSPSRTTVTVVHFVDYH